MKENRRKCVMCGSSPADDPETALFRFPKPGSTNILRCELWAKHCYPDKSWSNTEFQMKLHTEHRMLCHRHFKESSFVDFPSKKLRRFASPDEENIPESSPLGLGISRVTLAEHIETPHTPVSSSREQLPAGKTMEEVPDPSTSCDYIHEHIAPVESRALVSNTPSVTPKPIYKKRYPILKNINASKTSDLTPRELLLYNLCRKKMRTINKLKYRLKNIRKRIKKAPKITRRKKDIRLPFLQINNIKEPVASPTQRIVDISNKITSEALPDPSTISNEISVEKKQFVKSKKELKQAIIMKNLKKIIDTSAAVTKLKNNEIYCIIIANTN